MAARATSRLDGQRVLVEAFFDVKGKAFGPHIKSVEITGRRQFSLNLGLETPLQLNARQVAAFERAFSSTPDLRFREGEGSNVTRLIAFAQAVVALYGQRTANEGLQRPQLIPVTAPASANSPISVAAVSFSLTGKQLDTMEETIRDFAAHHFIARLTNEEVAEHLRARTAPPPAAELK